MSLKFVETKTYNPICSKIFLTQWFEFRHQNVPILPFALDGAKCITFSLEIIQFFTLNTFILTKKMPNTIGTLAACDWPAATILAPSSGEP